jgi:TolB protein
MNPRTLFLLILVLLPPCPPRLRGEPVRLTTDGDFKQHLQWSPDGSKILLTRIHEGQMALWVLNADGSGLKRLLPELRTPHFDGHWSPDGRHVLFVLDILQGTDGKLQINRCAADGSDNQVVVPHKAFEESPRWAPDGRSFVWVSTRDGNQELYRADADGKNVKRLTSEVAADNTPAWAPDGRRLAFTSGRAGNFEIFTMAADGSDLKRLTQTKCLNYWPAWSPDGKRIAFTSNRDGNYEIYLMNADGSGVRNLTRHPAQDNFAAWSPDSKRIAFVSTRDGGHDVYVMDVE